ncbi:type III polyketide synthase [Paenactinomyces guangxiensis]|uniref:Type III polyketide synthase n=1 Tax=Paenactinomyces guangxiensis TaxID=1490290 RepID=A0A7W1WPL6_9BACL|nr:3-oxoacyl-[acyl-carrier-protein] synthase III C-terminal domain-containing protein [Paenactinomyces guangxiensis]MBA4493680.1 type III polyketide synthase [Paenactinomyces guangxiensis]MBH8590967.1 type III polyketide synthase [Paenactinomyces guangxiensis]
MAKIISVGTAVPPYEIEQEEVRNFAKELFEESYENIDRMLTIFENTSIQKRRFSRPREWFETERSFSERNQAYIETACQLGEEAILTCLNGTGLKPHDIDHIFFISTTGMATPSIDAYLINRLEMDIHIKRTPIWGLGCAGGVAGLARAYEYARAFPESRVLLLALECCGLTFRRNDMSKSNLVATSLFGDGAAAVLVAGEEAHIPHPVEGPEIVDTMSTVWPHSLDVMGWEINDDGLKVIFSKNIPAIVRNQIKPVVDQFLERRQLDLSRVEHYITHPGGIKVVQAYQETLGVPVDKFKHAYSVLKSFGNMSSATVLFVLERELLESHTYGSYGLMAALGPGFSSEMLLLRWGSEASGRLPSRRQHLKKQIKWLQGGTHV